MEYIAHDVARVWKSEGGARTLDELLAVLYFGDGIEVLERKLSATKVRLGAGREGWVRGALETTAEGPLALAFIDVGQGDACLVTTPGGHRLLVDGGENVSVHAPVFSAIGGSTAGSDRDLNLV